MYKLNEDFILRFEFFGGLIHNTSNVDEYILDEQTTILLYLLNNGVSYDLCIDELKRRGYNNVDIKPLIDNKVIVKSNNKSKYDLNKINEKIDFLLSRSKKINFLSSPNQVSLYLTSKCQLRCKFCYFKDKLCKYPESSIYNWLNVIRKLKKMGVLYISLLGGEPTLYNDIDLVLQELDKNKIISTITTNGIYMKNSTFDIIKNSKYITPTYSLQSLNGDINSFLTGQNGDKTLNLIKKFRKYGKDIRINVVSTIQDFEDMKKMIDFCHSEGIKNLYYNIYMSFEKNNLYNKEFLEYRQIDDIIKQYVLKNNYNVNVQVQGCLLYSAYYDKNININTEYEKIKFGCEAANTKIEIMPNGDILPCAAFNSNIAIDNCFESNIEDIWFNSKLLNDIRNMNNNDSNCQKCKFNSFCKGGCPAYRLHKHNNINMERDDRCKIIF